MARKRKALVIKSTRTDGRVYYAASHYGGVTWQKSCDGAISFKSRKTAEGFLARRGTPEVRTGTKESLRIVPAPSSCVVEPARGGRSYRRRARKRPGDWRPGRK